MKRKSSQNIYKTKKISKKNSFNIKQSNKISYKTMKVERLDTSLSKYIKNGINLKKKSKNNIPINLYTKPLKNTNKNESKEKKLYNEKIKKNNNKKFSFSSKCKKKSNNNFKRRRIQ